MGIDVAGIGISNVYDLTKVRHYIFTFRDEFMWQDIGRFPHGAYITYIQWLCSPGGYADIQYTHDGKDYHPFHLWGSLFVNPNPPILIPPGAELKAGGKNGKMCLQVIER